MTEGARTGMCRLRGSVDFSRLPTHAAAIAVQREGAVDRVRFPGLDLAWNPHHVCAAFADGVFALASGRARTAQIPVSAAGSDAARWIELYQRHGIGAAAQVGGAFAVALIDLGKQQVALLVDRFAMETMCYRTTAGAFAFSDSCSDVPGGSREIDPQAIFDYLYFHVIPAPGTIFRDVRRVEHANVVVANRGDARSQPYWTPVFEEEDHRHLSARMDTFVETVRHSVEEEADDGRTACFLSGGTDSSTIAAMLTRVRQEPANAYSIGFESAGYDEMEYARLAARHLGLVHHAYYVTPDDLVGAIPQVAASFDQPFGNSSVLPAYFCALRAKEDGFTRMLAGDGGDELFGGNSRYATQKVFELYHRLPQWLRKTVLEPPATRWPLFRKVPGLRQAGGYVRHARVEMPDRLESFNLLHAGDGPGPFSEDFRARVDTTAAIARQRVDWKASEGCSLLNRMLVYDWKYTLACSDLPKVRMATQFAGMTAAYPLLSREITDLSLRLPPEWKLKGLKLRWFFKHSLRHVLPKEILRKKKHGFGLPFGPWCLRHPPLRKLAENALESMATRDIFHPEFARNVLVKQLPQAPGYFGEMVWILMMLEMWLQTSSRFSAAETK